VGEALVSFLDEKGTPTMVERAWILPPSSRIGPITEAERAAVINASPIKGTYDQTVDRESAYERLRARTSDRQGPGKVAMPAPVPGAPPAPTANTNVGGSISSVIFGTTGPRGGHHEGLLEVAAKSATRAISSGAGRSIVRGVLGSIFGGRR
jgi:DNA helicase HerA-like ATPase